MIGVSQTGGV